MARNDNRYGRSMPSGEDEARRKNGKAYDYESEPDRKEPPKKKRSKDFYTGQPGTNRQRPRSNTANLREKIRKEGAEGRRKRGVRNIAQDAASAKKRKDRLRALLVVLSVLALLIIVLVLIYKFLFVVSDIQVDGAGTYTSEEIVEASGIKQGVNLYSFRASTAEKRITMRLPLIKSADVTRTPLNHVNIKVVTEEAMFKTEIYSEMYALSSDLRIVGKIDGTENLIKLKLPEISYAINGRKIQFVNSRNGDTVDDLIAVFLDSPLIDRYTMIDLRYPYELTAAVDAKFKLIIGDDSRLEYKLRTASEVLKDEMFTTDNKMRVDLTIEGKTSVVIDNMLDLD